MQRIMELIDWCRALPPDMVFFFALPFGVAAVAVAAVALARGAPRR